MLTDGEHTYLTDFGLALDKSFALTNEEEAFFEQNTFYDDGEILRNLGHLIRSSYDSCSEQAKRKLLETYDITPTLPLYKLSALLLAQIEQIHQDGVMTLDPFYVTSIAKYRKIIALMQDFFAEMWANDQKDTTLPHAELQRLLQETGFLANTD